MRPLVLGTAGHIDHGKTALVRALTGTDTDRLPDEKRRGITIDLGFARLDLPDGATMAIVDVPGHEAFVRNMLAGATGIDVVMLVVAADEGPMPQTLEHIAILGLLGIQRGVVALTKTDLVEPEWLELVRDETRETLAPTPLANAPIIDVSARTGAGLDDLLAALATAAAGVPDRSAADLFRMPIDRVFTVRGTGTVVTGTVWSGTVRRDAHVGVLPAGFEARIRALQRHGIACDDVAAGSRAAIALAGVERSAITRGDTLVAGDGWTAAGTLTVRLSVLPDAEAPIRPRQRIRVHVGTAEVLGRVTLVDADLEPGTSTIAQLRLERPVITRAGDLFVVRSWSPVHTIGGGMVLEPAAPKRKRLSADLRAALDDLASLAPRSGAAATPGTDVTLVRAAVMLAGDAGLDAARLPLATGLPPDTALAAVAESPDLTRSGTRVVRADVMRRTQEQILAAVAAFHAAEPMLDGIEKEAARRAVGDAPLFDAAAASLVVAGDLAVPGNAFALPGHSAIPAGEARIALERLAAVFDAAGLEPPDLDELPAELRSRPDLPLLVRFLERDGTLIRLSPTRLIGARRVSDGVVALRSQLATGQPLGVSDFRDVLNLTRRHLIPLLEHFDRTGVTRRTGDSRVLLDA